MEGPNPNTPIGQHIQLLQNALDMLTKHGDDAQSAAQALRDKLGALRAERDASKSASQKLMVA
eukprot:3999164-Pyramimonas_sp.AAC.1